MPDSGIREVTEPIGLAIVDDRLHFTVTSGTRERTYSISLHKAANAAMCTNLLLAEQRQVAHRDNVRAFKNQ